MSLTAPAKALTQEVHAQTVGPSPTPSRKDGTDRESAALLQESPVGAPAPNAPASGTPQSVVVTLQLGHKVASLAGAKVEITSDAASAFDGDAVAPLATIAIDQSGECRAELPNGAPGDSLLARVAEPGWCQVATKLRLDSATQTWSGRLKVQHGVTVRGRLLDPSGAGVKGTIRLMGRFTSENLGGGVSKKSGEDGSFTLHSYDYLFGPNSGRTPVLYAESDGIGTAMIPAFDLSRYGSAPGRAEPLVVQLQGSGVLRGRLVDSSGAGVPAATIVARAVSGGTPGTPRAPKDELLDGSGFRRAMTITEQDGWFELRGLRAEDFWIASAAHTQPWEEKGTTLLTPSPVPSDGAMLRLTQDRPALTIELLGVDGERWSGPVNLEGGLPHTGQMRDWPVSPALRVEQRSPGATYGRRLVGRVSSDGLLVFPLDGAQDASVQIMGGKAGSDGFLPTRHEVQWSDATAEGQLRLRIQAIQLAPLGTIELDGTVAARSEPVGWVIPPSGPTEGPLTFGDPVPPAAVLEPEPITYLLGHTLEVSLLPPSGSPIQVLNSRAAGWGEGGIRNLELPEGRYRWRIAPAVYGDWSQRAHCGGAEGIVDVLSGQATRAKCRIDAGSTVRVLVEGTESVDLYLERPDGSTFNLAYPDRQRTNSRWYADAVRTSVIVASGSYDLIARFTESGVKRRFPVTLTPGNCLDVRVAKD